MTAMEAVGEDAAAGAPAAVIGFLHGLRDDWRALVAGAEAENSEPSRMEGYARIVTGVGSGRPVGPAGGARGVRGRGPGRDAEIVERRREELAFVQKADMHCRNDPSSNGRPRHAARRYRNCRSMLSGWQTVKHSRRPDAGCRRAPGSSTGLRPRSSESSRASAATRRSGSAKRWFVTRSRRSRQTWTPAIWRGPTSPPNRRGRSGTTSFPESSAGRSRRGAPGRSRLFPKPRGGRARDIRDTRRRAAASTRSCRIAAII